MAMPFENLYHLRKVAESAAKPCMVCYKPTTSVLVTPDKKDFFYVCPGHPKDRGFSTAVDPGPTPEELEKKRKEEDERALAEEIERVKKEYEEEEKKKKKKKEKGDNKGKEGDDEKGKEKEKKDQKEDKEEDKGKEKDKKETVLENKRQQEEPRVFRLHKTIFESRLRRWRQQQITKLNQDRVRLPDAFPSVPKDDPV